jgi:hypothetical protein
MKLIAWILCLAALDTAVASDEATFSIQDGDVYLQTPSEFGSFIVNGKNIGEYLGKVDDLVVQFATLKQENKDLQVSSFN